MKSLQLDPKKTPIMNIIIWTNRNELVDIKASVTLSNSAHSTYDDTSDFLGDDSFFSSSLQILCMVPGYGDSGDNKNIGPYFSGRLTAMFNTTWLSHSFSSRKHIFGNKGKKSGWQPLIWMTTSNRSHAEIFIFFSWFLASLSASLTMCIDQPVDTFTLKRFNGCIPFNFLAPHMSKNLRRNAKDVCD